MTREERAQIRKKLHTAYKRSGILDAYVPLDESARRDIPALSTGSIVLNALIGNDGWPEGRVVEVFGPESVGKTTVAIAACIEAQKRGGVAVYIDFEHALHLGYAQAMGLDLSEDAFEFYQPDHFEQGAMIAYNAAKHLKADIVVLDSVAAMIPQAEFEKGPDAGTGALGLQARLMSKFMNQITKELTKAGTLLFVINQMRSNIKTSRYDAGPDWTTTGGKALPYYATIRLRLKPGKTEQAMIDNKLTGGKDKIPVSNFVRAESHKNKVGFPKRKGEFVIRYGEGIDNCRSIIDVAERYKIIKKAGSWYEYKHKDTDHVHHLKRQGVEQLRKALLEKPEIFQELASEVMDKLIDTQIMKIDAELSDDDLTVVDRSHLDIDEDQIIEEDDDFTFDEGDIQVDDTPEGILSLDDLSNLEVLDE
tara:strand:+ start:3495 stop:4757 length:1263 start_codon:yes stop_codon:yes gene_type:complete